MRIQGMTKYLKSAIAESSHPVVPFKDDNFVSLSYEELLLDKYEINAAHPICTLLQTNEYKKLFEPLPQKEKKAQTVQMPCLVSYKTLKTVFSEQKRLKKHIAELTGIYYFPFQINFIRTGEKVQVQYTFDKDNIPWYARSFMSPKYIQNIPTVTDVNLVDKYKSDTTEVRAQIKTWPDYIRYCDQLFSETADQALPYEEKCFIFRYEEKAHITNDLLQLYEKLEEDNTEHKLYDEFTCLFTEQASNVTTDYDINAEMSHCGQMNGKFHLADSQRIALHYTTAIQNGEVLAVSGPPGTGKTTLLQSVVADLIVKCALNHLEPPIIVATSANNQAVTNIIDSFSSVQSVGIKNLEQRWVNGVKSFATYMPSQAKMKEAQEKRYQYTSVRGCEFICEAEKEIEDSKIQMKDSASTYLEKFFDNIHDVKAALMNELKDIDILRKQLISLSADVSKFTDGKELVAFIAELEQQKCDLEAEVDMYQNRLLEWEQTYKSIGKFQRWFSFIPSVKKTISAKLIIAASTDEMNFIDEKVTFAEISKYYSERIVTGKKSIASTVETLYTAAQFLDMAKEIVLKLQSKNCNMSIISDGRLTEFDPDNMHKLIDTKIRYVEFWMAVHINECRFLEGEYCVKNKQRGTTHRNVLQKFYRQIALLSPCFVMTVYKMPSNFKCYDGGYLFDYIDLLIFDEAGQCAPEVAVANFSFAKKALVVGDEYQIPPVYNLDLPMDITLAVQSEVVDVNGIDTLIDCGLSCSLGSVMQAAKMSCKYQTNDKTRGLFLCEHRRCYDEIIGYCNELVYDGLLIPMRNSDEKAAKKARKLDCKKYPLMGYYNISSQGSRQMYGSRTNEYEAIEIAEWLKQNFTEICSVYIKENPTIDTKNILAIITPFSAQRYLIKKYLKEKMGDIADNISVGTVHTFQGAERNIIIFSTVYGSNDSGAFIDNNKNLMNVAVSRAKDAFWVFGDYEFLRSKQPNTASGLLYNRITGNPVISEEVCSQGLCQ